MTKTRLDDRIADQRAGVSRRTMLRGAAGAAMSLPLMESFVPRDVQAAQGGGPHYLLIAHQANGVAQGDHTRNEADRWWPSETGAISPQSLAADNRATSELSSYADRMLVVSGIDSTPRMGFDGHAGAAANFLTVSQLTEADRATNPQAGNESIDTLIADKMTPGSPPLHFQAGGGGGSNTQLCWVAAGRKRAIDLNPNSIYQRLFAGRNYGDANAAEAEAQLAAGRASAVDLVREELNELRRMNLSRADNESLELHLASIRDYEVRAVEVSCTPLDETVVGRLDGITNQVASSDAAREEMVDLHARLLALAFACDDHRVAVMRFGAIADGTHYPSPDGGTLPFNYHSVSHRVNNIGGDGGAISEAYAYHQHIDRIILRQFSKFLHYIDERTAPNGNSLLDESTCVFSGSLGFGRLHTRHNLPFVVVGSGGGFWKQGQFINLRNSANRTMRDKGEGVGGVRTNRMMNMLIASAGVRDESGEMLQEFGNNPDNSPGLIPELFAS